MCREEDRKTRPKADRRPDRGSSTIFLVAAFPTFINEMLAQLRLMSGHSGVDNTPHT